MTEFRSADMEVAALHDLLLAYYREGEDADTPEAELEDFISYLQGLLDEGVLLGFVVFREEKPIAFMLYTLDREGFPFSEKPGYGTICEIGVIPEARHTGLGRELAHMAEAMFTEHFYVCAHPDAQGFWRKCGYEPSGETAANGLPILTKHVLKRL